MQNSQRTNKKLFSALTICVLFTVIATSCTSSSSSDGDSKPLGAPVSTSPKVASLLGTIKASGRIRIGVKFDVPLFGLKSPDGPLTGFDIEMATVIAKKLFPNEANPKDRIDFVEAISKNRERFLQQHTVDLVISTYTINAARKELVDFAGPYYIAGQDILTLKSEITSGRIRGVGDANGKKVCSVTGSTSLNNLREAAPNADTSITKDKYSECFEALTKGLVDAMSTDDAILLGLAQGNPDFAVTGNPFHTEPYGIGISKGDDELRNFVNDALQESFENGEWEKAFQTTIGTTGALAPQPPTLDRYTTEPA
jgi:glutamate transport system substrate-binding protein